jgi:hypothetical protein
MKKLIVVLGVVAFACSFVACKKDCRCISTFDGEEMTNVVLPDKYSKSDCEAYKMTVIDGYEFECKSE